jgi:hypothetical protein
MKDMTLSSVNYLCNSGESSEEGAIQHPVAVALVFATLVRSPIVLVQTIGSP